MNSHTQQLAHILTYSGTLPLLGALGAVFFSVAGVDAVHIARTYSAVILSFLCGIHWAIYLFYSEKCPDNLFITSNAMALMSWCSLLLEQAPMAILVQSLCFIGILALDHKLRKAAILPSWFFMLRRNATIIVVSSLFMIIGII
jgi:hypothetical protein